MSSPTRDSLYRQNDDSGPLVDVGGSDDGAARTPELKRNELTAYVPHTERGYHLRRGPRSCVDIRRTAAQRSYGAGLENRR